MATKKNEKLLREFRGLLRCELCGTWQWCECHHVEPRGMGGGKRLDVRINLLSVCGLCHKRCGEKCEGERITKAEQWDAVAVREGYAGGQWVEEEVFRLLRQPKGSLSRGD